MKRFFTFLCLVFGLCVFLQCREYRPVEQNDLEYAIGQYWDFDIPMALAIRHAESLDGKWTFRYESTNIYHAKWVQAIPGFNEKFRKYGWYCISSCGDWQVFFPTALWMGYKGTPYELQHNIYTNAKYSAKIWKHYCRRYEKVEDRISSYNRGYSWKRWDGSYRNQKYVNLVMTNYVKWKNYECD